MGGIALGEVLAGDVSPGGKLPMTIPTSADHLPFFDREAEEIEYGYWHGYRKLDRENIEPAFPFGFGLSYTDFKLSDVEVVGDGDISIDDNAPSSLQHQILCSVHVENMGDVQGDEVVQVYASPVGSKIEPRAVKDLVSFRRVRGLQPKEKRVVEFAIPLERLAYYDEQAEDFRVEPCEYDLIFARSSRDNEGSVRARIRVSIKKTS